MHRVGRLKPVVIDESLTDFEILKIARQLGYSGIALKACKGQTESLLMAAAARHYGMLSESKTLLASVLPSFIRRLWPLIFQPSPLWKEMVDSIVGRK